MWNMMPLSPCSITGIALGKRSPLPRLLHMTLRIEVKQFSLGLIKSEYKPTILLVITYFFVVLVVKKLNKCYHHH